RLTWSAPYPGAVAYDIRFSTTGPIVTAADFSTATALGAASNTTNPPLPRAVGPETLIVTGLIPETTYWWAIKSSNNAGTSGVDTSSPEPNAIAGVFDGTQK